MHQTWQSWSVLTKRDSNINRKENQKHNILSFTPRSHIKMFTIITAALQSQRKKKQKQKQKQNKTKKKSNTTFLHSHKGLWFTAGAYVLHSLHANVNHKSVFCHLYILFNLSIFSNNVSVTNNLSFFNIQVICLSSILFLTAHNWQNWKRVFGSC